MARANEFERLEQALVRAGSDIAYPATPPLAEQIAGSLEGGARPRPAPSLSLRMPLGKRLGIRRAPLTLAAAVGLALVLLLALPVTRDALADILGLRTVRIFILPSPTATPTGTATPTLTLTPTGTVTPQPSATETPLPSPTPGSFVLCCETTLADAQARARFTILLPPGESPSRVYFEELDPFGGGQQVILLFGDPSAPRFTLYEAESLVYGKLLYMYGKGVDEGTVLAQTTVDGHDARWISGAPHLLVYLDPSGQPDPRTERTVDANTLVWETGTGQTSLTFRVETKLSESEAVRFAESLR